MMTVVPTIDVEGAHGPRPFAQFVRGDIDGAADDWGVFRQAAIFQRHGISATFFVDCYEYTLWGDGQLEDVCCRLVEMGQDVQIHTHPSWRDDIHDPAWLRSLKRDKSFLPQDHDFMAKLSFSQQVEVLERGIELLLKWIGRRPIAHRSGGYSIDENTVSALVKVGIPFDSSMRYGHRNSKIVWSANQLLQRQGLLELPVTVLRHRFDVPFVPGGHRFYNKILNTDLDCCRLGDFLAYVDHGLVLDVRVMNLFMHSYSLLRFDTFYRSIRPNPWQAKKLDGLLALLRQRSDVEFMSCTQIFNAYSTNPQSFDGSDAIPELRANAKIVRMALSKIKNLAADSIVSAFEGIACRRTSNCPSDAAA